MTMETTVMDIGTVKALKRSLKSCQSKNAPKCYKCAFAAEGAECYNEMMRVAYDAMGLLYDIMVNDLDDKK